MRSCVRAHQRNNQIKSNQNPNILHLPDKKNAAQTNKRLFLGTEQTKKKKRIKETGDDDYLYTSHVYGAAQYRFFIKLLGANSFRKDFSSNSICWRFLRAFSTIDLQNFDRIGHEDYAPKRNSMKCSHLREGEFRRKNP